jgi:hypothetical protein
MAEDFAIVISAQAARQIRLEQLRLARENFSRLERADERRQSRAERLAALKAERLAALKFAIAPLLRLRRELGLRVVHRLRTRWRH